MDCQPIADDAGSRRRPLAAAGLLLVMVAGHDAALGQEDDPTFGPDLRDPGRLFEQLEREQRYYGPDDELESDEPELDAEELEEGKLPEDTDESFVLRGVRFDESDFIDEERLQELAQPYVGEEVTFADVNDLVDEINAIYRELGLITARAIVPPQRIQEGILRIRLVEGETGTIELRGREYTDEAFLRSAVGLEEGETIDVPAMQRRLRGVNRLTPLQLGAQLRAGEDFGKSDVIVEVDEPPGWNGQVFVDNNGSESTGEEQLGVVGTWNGPLRRADRLTGFVIGSEGAASLSGTYAVPVRARGDMLTLQMSYSETEVVEGGFADLGIEGDSARVDVDYLAPAITARRWSIDWLAGASYVESATDAEGDPIADTEIDEVTLGLQGRGGSERFRWFVEQTVTSGRSEDVLGESDDYVRYPGSFSLVGPGLLGGAVQATGSWQYVTDDRIASPSEFDIGGVGTVRGYDNGVQAGARGAALSVEHHWRPDWYVDPMVFMDVGHVSGRDPESETIHSVGAGFNWQSGDWRANVSLAHALDDDVAPDQDDYRAHLRLSYAFGAER